MAQLKFSPRLSNTNFLPYNWHFKEYQVAKTPDLLFISTKELSSFPSWSFGFKIKLKDVREKTRTQGLCLISHHSQEQSALRSSRVCSVIQFARLLLLPHSKGQVLSYLGWLCLCFYTVLPSHIKGNIVRNTSREWFLNEYVLSNGYKHM